MARSDDTKQGGASSSETRELAEMLMSFRVTQIIYVAAKLGIADLLNDGPQTVEALAETTHTHAPSLYRLLRALASVGIFAEDEQGRFGSTPRAELLRAGVPGSMRSRALHYGEGAEWRAWGDLLYSVTTGEPGFKHVHGMDPWEFRAQHPEENEVFNDLMFVNTTAQTSAIVAAYDFSNIGTLVDVAGGHGALISAILRANPGVRGILCDAPHVVGGARLALEAAGVIDRCEIVPCDFFASVPGGGDTYILKYIIHDWDDAHAATILRTCRKVTPDHGRILLVETVIPRGNEPHRGKMLDLQMLVGLGGRERTEAEYEKMLGEAGFKMTRVVPTESDLSIIEAVPG